jgi:hypothetical protein
MEGVVSLLLMLPAKHYRDAATQKKTTIIAREETRSFFPRQLAFAECYALMQYSPAVEGKTNGIQQTWLSSTHRQSVPTTPYQTR